MPMVKKFMSTKEFVNSVLESAAIEEKKKKFEGEAYEKEAKKEFQANEGFLQTAMSMEGKKANYRTFLENAKSSLLEECIYKIYNESQGITIKNEGDESIKRSLVKSFVNENGTATLLSKFKYKNELLSEMSCLVDRYYNRILESTNPTDPQFSIDTSVTDDFFRDLNTLNADDATRAIQTRVTSAMDEFIQANVDHKNDIEQALKDAKDKAFLTDSDSVKESYEHQAKKKITNIRNKPVNVFGSMVHELSEAVIKNDNIKPEYIYILNNSYGVII